MALKRADSYMAGLRKAEAIFTEGVAAENKDEMKTAVRKYIAAGRAAPV